MFVVVEQGMQTRTASLVTAIASRCNKTLRLGIAKQLNNLLKRYLEEVGKANRNVESDQTQRA